ncbi:MAG TPA: penicillin acylase family protein, partial [Anaerolineae bacterium]|nr:penicillin acylase family protein [Anaerolineae bacterium]
MRRILVRVLIGIALVILLLILFGAGAAYWLITRPLPQTSGTLQLAGLSAPVAVIRDYDGVPHIYGDTEDDLYMAQGFVHAQDRLWQMEFNRHIGHGQLAELFGEEVLDKDKFLRTIGLGRAAQRDWENSDADTQRHLEKYAQGVNAFIHTHQDNLPIEFVLLGYEPADWQPVDTLVWGKVMAYDLGGNYDRELLRAALKQELGDAAMRALIPAYPPQGPFIIPPNVKSYATSSYTPADSSFQDERALMSLGAPNFAKINSINSFLGAMSEGLGSNNWVLDGTKTTTGKPLLANDPHLGIQMPSIWYLNALHCNSISDACRFNVVGYSFPGVPGVIIGHNDRIAWGVTNVSPDIQDLYVEKINPANPNQYEYMGKWQ